MTGPHAEFEVASTGLLATVQDLGRPGHAHLGVPRSGGADLESFALANRLVGNLEDAACVEVTLGGFSARLHGTALVAVAGPTTVVRVDGREVGSHSAIALKNGQTLSVTAPRRGCRNYVSVRGGFAVAAELGSRSTDTLSGLGPAPLAVGDELPVGTLSSTWPAVMLAPPAPCPASPTVTLTVRLGPRADRLVAPDSLTAGAWVVNPASNRIGVRVDRPIDSTEPVVAQRDLPEIASEGVPLGGVQIPPSGQPVMFLADHPVTGGYPVVAVLTPSSLHLAAQLVAGDRVRFDLG
ncbi:biotin-dependent carboxyltransferase family protein [Gordonia liuliyuniae]|uniref:Biotin-dependent carboxyltransferase family protein n=1 Tax=Gordonia liuliyuniae TaxID=2911517 RepID=A0ABS9IMU9_9ACTN|nr:biotin-dependent carboxyltransferase family protein [Gordonia liuliyuniae]MCF8586880.1 biotin-dependent carboxyltransferase family protein [Gordonia liuliyuniae]